MRGLKIISLYLLAIGAVVALQLHPPIGILLMMFLGGFWAALLFNAMLIHIAVEVVCRRVSVAWLLPPLVIYFVWGSFAWIDYLNASGYRDQQNAAAAAIPKPSPSPSAMLIEASNPTTADEVATEFIKIVDGVRVFANASEFLMIDATDERCQWKAESSIKRRGYTFSNQRASRRLSEKMDRCVISTPSEVPGPIVKLTIETVGVSRLPYDHYKQVYDKPGYRTYIDDRPMLLSTADSLRFAQRIVLKIKLPNGDWSSVGEVQQGSILYLFPIPFFGAGCGLNSGNPSWECFFEIFRLSLDFGIASGFPTYGGPGRSYYMAQAFGIPVRQ